MHDAQMDAPPGHGKTAPSCSHYLLEMEGIDKMFPGVRALDGVRFDLRG